MQQNKNSKLVYPCYKARELFIWLTKQSIFQFNIKGINFSLLVFLLTAFQEMLLFQTTEFHIVVCFVTFIIVNESKILFIVL